jgi:hypothetical protein
MVLAEAKVQERREEGGRAYFKKTPERLFLN